MKQNELTEVLRWIMTWINHPLGTITAWVIAKYRCWLSGKSLLVQFLWSIRWPPISENSLKCIILVSVCAFSECLHCHREIQNYADKNIEMVVAWILINAHSATYKCLLLRRNFQHIMNIMSVFQVDVPEVRNPSEVGVVTVTT